MIPGSAMEGKTRGCRLELLWFRTCKRRDMRAQERFPDRIYQFSTLRSLTMRRGPTRNTRATRIYPGRDRRLA